MEIAVAVNERATEVSGDADQQGGEEQEDAKEGAAHAASGIQLGKRCQANRQRARGRTGPTVKGQGLGSAGGIASKSVCKNNFS
jgi:hypothetical protein